MKRMALCFIMATALGCLAAGEAAATPAAGVTTTPVPTLLGQDSGSAAGAGTAAGAGGAAAGSGRAEDDKKGSASGGEAVPTGAATAGSAASTGSLIDRLEWFAGGYFSLAFPSASVADTSLGFELAGFGLARVDLMPGNEKFPFPAVVPFRLEFKYVGGEDRWWNPTLGWDDTDVSSVFLLVKADFGINVLWTMKGMWLFPFVGVGTGIESVSGSHIGYDGTDFIFSFQLGVAFAYFIQDTLFILARGEYCRNIGADNIVGNFALGGGVGFKIG